MIRRGWIAGFACLLIIGAGFWSRFRGETSVREDSARKALETVLSIAAQAEESYYIAYSSYTTEIDELKARGPGLVVEPGITLSVARADEESYCIEASRGDLTWHYDSSEASEPQEGGCSPAVPTTAEEAEAELRQQLEILLHDMAIAQEQFRTSHPRYTDDIRDLIAGGMDIPPDVDVSDISIVLAIRSDYCMEARAQDLTYFYWALRRGGPEEGSCAESVGSAANDEREVRANLEHVLRDAYNAMYSFWNSHQRFTRKVDQLVKRGFQPVRGIDLRVAFVDEDQFCLEASGGGLTYFSWDDYGSEGECGVPAP